MRSKFFPMFSALRATALATICFTSTGHAADQAWNSAGPTDSWATTAPNLNWDAGVAWTQNNNAIFGGTGDIVTLTEAIHAGNLTFNGTGFTISGNTLTLASGDIVNTDANDATINSAIVGGPVSKSGTGTLVLGGTNTFSSGLTINAGTLQAKTYDALSIGAVTLNAAATDDVTLFHDVENQAANNIQVSGAGSGLAILKWSQDWWGSTGKGYNTFNDWTLTLNRAVNFRSTNSGKQIAPFVTGPGVAAGEVAVKIDGGTQVTWTSAMNAANDAVQVNNFTGNVWVTGNTKLQGQNRAYQSDTAPYYNGLIPDSATLIVDAGSLFQLHHGAETIGFLSGEGTVNIGTGTPGNALTIAGDSSTPSTGGETGTATFSGTLSTNQSALTKNGTGTQEFSGPNVKYSQGTNLNDGKLKLSMTTAWASNVTFGALNSPKLQLNTPLATDSWTFAKTLNGGSATASVDKIGLGSVTLTGGGTFSGSLKVSGGKLLLGNGFSAVGPVTMLDSTHFGGSVSVGNITVPNGSTLEGGNGGSGTLTAANVVLGSLVTDTSSLKGTLSASSGYKPLAVSNLTINSGNASVLLNAAGAGLTNGVAYDMLVSTNPITAPGASSVLNAFKSNSRTYTPIIDGTGTKVQLLYDQKASLYWVGASGNWNTSTTNDWKLSGNNAFTTFQNNDTVFFHSNPSSSSILINTADVIPGAVIFDNTITTEYVLDGADNGAEGTFGIAAGSITKSNGGNLEIRNHNSTSGPIGLNGGIVTLWWDDGLGTGPITFDGGQLTYDAYNADGTPWTRDITINANGGAIEMTDASGTLSLAGNLSGTGILTKLGTGTLELAKNTGTVALNIKIEDGELALNSSGGAVTYAGNFTGSTGSLRLVGTGASGSTGLTLTGNNTFSGETNIYGRRIFLNSATPNGAIGGDVVISSGNWPYHGLTIMTDEQIADTAVLRFEQTNDAYDFRLNGKTETLAGIQSLDPSQQGGGTWCIIENAGYDGGNDTGIAAGTLIVSGSGEYTYYGQLRNQNGGTNGALNFAKSGAGTQLLGGSGVNYTGTTNVNNGKLVLENTTNFASSGVTVNAGTLTVNNTSGTGTGTCPTVTIQTGGTLAGNGSVGGIATIAAGATVAPGNSAGILTLATASLTGTYQCQLDGIDGDQLNVTGSLDITGGAIIVSVLADPTAPSYTILTYGSLIGTLPTIVPPAGYVVNTDTPGVVKLVSSAAGYNTWANSWTGPALSDKTPGGDPDHDGISNLMEYVIGGDPRISSTQFLPTQAIVGSNLVLSYKRSDASEIDTVQVGQWSVSLGDGSWTAVTPVLVNENAGDPDDMTVTVPLSNAVNGKLFLRLKVTMP